MGFLTFFSRKKQPENYEQVLEDLRLSIQSRQSRLADIRLRERRSTLWVTLYLLAGWFLYVGIWYAGWMARLAGVNDLYGSKVTLRKIIIGIPVLVSPVIILFTRRIVQLWYTRIGNAEEATLKKLMLEQRAKLEEIKKKTDFYSTQKLLERYDRPEANNMATPARKPMPAQGRVSAAHNGVGPVTPVSNAAGSAPGSNPQGLPPATPMHPGYLSAVTPQPLQPTPRRWYDRLADAVLGDDESASGAHNKYALICKRCFTHNGLVKESEWETIQFVCMKCGFLNPAPKPQANLQADATLPLDSSPMTPTPAAQPVRPASPPSPSPEVSAVRRTRSMAKDKKEDGTASEQDAPAPQVRRRTTGGRKSKAKAEAEGYEMEVD